jgi:hypothetical protein
MTAAGSTGQAPEGLVILGMHRSGTSLTTRLVNLLGLAVCRDDDLLLGGTMNPRGHWESKSLIRFNDRLLGELGGSWFCPPLLGPKEFSRMMRRHASDALATLQAAHPQQPWVWKDPRTCVLLPFWSAVLEQRAAYMLVVRHPFEVSDSLARLRNGFSPLLSLALWERYTRDAMLGAAGRPLMVCTYDEVLADPVAWCERAVTFMSELGMQTRAVDPVAVGAFVSDDLRNSRQSWTDLQPGPLISPEQVALAKAASAFTVQRSYVPPDLPAETPETASIFREIASRAGRRLRPADLPARLLSGAPDAASGEQSTRPPVSVVVARHGTAAEETTALVLGATLPAGSEVLIAAADHAQADAWSRLEHVSLRQIDCEQPPSEAEALALGVEAASAPLVLLTTGGLLRCDPWYAHVTEALALPAVAAAGPAMRFDSSPDIRYFGRAFTDEDLASGFLAGQAAQTLVPAALLSATHCACDRRVLAAAGGIDAGFASASAAIAEISVRLWRMGFRCCIVGQVEAWAENPEEDRPEEAGGLYDRLRIATLHLSPPSLQAFTNRASRLPSYEAAAERLATSDVQRRRATIEAVCAFPSERYFEQFPLRPSTQSTLS